MYYVSCIIIYVLFLFRRKDFPLSSLYSEKAPIMDWGWLRSAAGMYSSVNDLAKVRFFSVKDLVTVLTGEGRSL